MDFLQRYHNGEYEQVWNDLQNLGKRVCDEPLYTQAREVAAETMSRVRRNCERLVTNLRALGYVFGTFPDGSRRSEVIEPLTPPWRSLTGAGSLAWLTRKRHLNRPIL